MACAVPCAMQTRGYILAACMAAPSAPSRRDEMEGREHLGTSSTGGESGGWGVREYEVGADWKYEPAADGL